MFFSNLEHYNTTKLNSLTSIQ